MTDYSLAKEFDASFSRLLQPDFSGYIRDGVFDGMHALQGHLFNADFLLKTAIAMTAAGEIAALPNLDDRLYVIEMNLKTYREAVEAAIVEINRLFREFSPAQPRGNEAQREERG